MFANIIAFTILPVILGQTPAYLPSVDMVTGNTTNTTNHTYEVILEQFNSSNCSVPFHNISYEFNCSGLHNKTWCCADEYSKLNMSFGNAECNQYEVNDTYVRFHCQNYSGRPSKKMNPYVVAAIAVGFTVGFVILIFLLVKCMLGCNRNRYDKI